MLFKKALAVNFIEPPGSPDLPLFRLVDMYMSCTEEPVKEEIMKSFTKEITLRIVIATVAFGWVCTVLGFEKLFT